MAAILDSCSCYLGNSYSLISDCCYGNYLLFVCFKRQEIREYNAGRTKNIQKLRKNTKLSHFIKFGNHGNKIIVT